MSNALDEALRSAVAGLRPVKRSGTAAPAGIRPGSALSVDATLKLFDAQATSRHLDFAARALQAMLLVTAGYLVGGALVRPDLWLDPMGPLLKSIPAAFLALAALTTLDER